MHLEMVGFFAMLSGAAIALVGSIVMALLDNPGGVMRLLFSHVMSLGLAVLFVVSAPALDAKISGSYWTFIAIGCAIEILAALCFLVYFMKVRRRSGRGV